MGRVSRRGLLAAAGRLGGLLATAPWLLAGVPAAAAGLVGEAGLSYLVRTDGHTVLFDVGANLEGRDPSPWKPACSGWASGWPTSTPA